MPGGGYGPLYQACWGGGGVAAGGIAAAGGGGGSWEGVDSGVSLKLIAPGPCLPRGAAGPGAA